MKNYKEMSDFEINEQVANLMGGYAGNVHGSESKVKVKDPESCGLFYMEVDYCNNPSDAWPIIIQNGISIEFDIAEDGSTAWWNSYDISDLFRTQYHKNPLRAAMIVFLITQEPTE